MSKQHYRKACNASLDATERDPRRVAISLSCGHVIYKSVRAGQTAVAGRMHCRHCAAQAETSRRGTAAARGAIRPIPTCVPEGYVLQFDSSGKLVGSKRQYVAECFGQFIQFIMRRGAGRAK